MGGGRPARSGDRRRGVADGLTSALTGPAPTSRGVAADYYHASISVNSLLIFDPNETAVNENGDAGINCGGQRMPIRDAPKNLTALLDPDNDYHIGSVVAHGWEPVPTPTVPSWHWLSGDITGGWSPRAAARRLHAHRSVYSAPAATADPQMRTPVTRPAT